MGITGATTPRAVLFSRDGTLIVNVPYNGDPTRVELTSTAAEAVAYLRVRGIPLGVLSNQPAVGYGWITSAEVQRVNMRTEQLLGPFGTWQVCLHAPEDSCQCRMPKPRLIYAAASALGFPTSAIAVIANTGTAMKSALLAGATGVLVPADRTQPDEILTAEHTARDLVTAVRRLFPSGTRQAPNPGDAPPRWRHLGPPQQ